METTTLKPLIEQNKFEQLYCQADGAPFLFAKQDSNICLTHVQSTLVLRAPSHKIH